jgi:hypothetical protein
LGGRALGEWVLGINCKKKEGFISFLLCVTTFDAIIFISFYVAHIDVALLGGIGFGF